MDELIKKAYKISLWDEETVYIITTGQEKDRYETTTLPKSGEYTVLNQYQKESCLAVIGADTLNTPIRAFDSKLTRKVTGENTLSFQIYSKYYDEEEEVFKDNPFIKLLVNERKVKLQYDNEWLEFIIKEIQENSEGNVFAYTCKDLYINELAKTGYDLEFAVELENNMGTITDLAEVILEESDWEVDRNGSDVIQQTNKEALYVCELKSAMNATCLADFSYGDETYVKGAGRKFEAGEIIYVFYSSFVNKENPVQFIFHKQDTVEDGYITDEEGVIVNGANWEFTPTDSFFKSNLRLSSEFFGKKLISKQISKYISEIDKYCGLYKKGEEDYYGYSETEYASVGEVQNLLTNGMNFISTNGWVGVGDASVLLSHETVSEKTYPALEFNFADGSADDKIINSGLYDNRNATKGFTKGETYIFMVEATPAKKGNSITGAQVVLKQAGSDPSTLLEFKSSTTKDDYQIFEASCKISISYNDLLKKDIDFCVFGKGQVKVRDAKFFKKVVGKDNKPIIPDLETTINSIIKTKYYFFPCSLINGEAQTVFDVSDITFSNVCYEEEVSGLGYVPVRSENYEKIRSITASKSNRFNLIQDLCESFECWASFSIEHTARGQVKYLYEKVDFADMVEGKTYYLSIPQSPNMELDSDFKICKEKPVEGKTYYQKKYDKKVAFKRFIGQDNYAGFKYGINLKSIQRTVNSDQIVTKMIVEPNTNEFAENGSCTIQTSVLNPTGENVLYNFNYYVRHKLLDEEVLFRDLYDEEDGLGLYIKLRRLNDQAAPLINESIPISNTLNKLLSRKTTYSAMVTEAEELRDEAIREISVAAGVSIEKAKELTKTETENNHVKDFIMKRDRAQSTIDNYSTLLADTTALVNGYNTKLAEINTTLNAIAKQKKALNSEFYKKYSRFIQEGSWSSSDHINAEDYYLDSEMVLHTSAFPKVTYTINVIDIGQVEGFGAYTFKVGDKTYIEDTEFFGWQSNGRPYQEEIVVSEVSYGLDDPSKNTIKVQNFKTQFEDLFQRITATTQSLQYHEGEYKRAAGMINSDGSIKSSLLQDSMNNNSLIIKNAKDESVVWDETGITISNSINPNKIVRLVSGGIALSSDSGRTWTTGITGEGINANVITTGRLDTNRIRIFNANHQTFEWNSDGINAYMTSEAGIPDYGKFVRFNQYGLFGYIGNDAGGLNNIENVVGNSIFSLTWKGLRINVPKGQEQEAININDKFIVAGNGNVTLKNATITWKSGSEGDGATPPSIEILPDFDTYKAEVQSQLDEKAETWYQNTDPSSAWKTPEAKELHVGDLWHYTGDTGTVNGANRIKNSEWIWRKTSEKPLTYTWEAIEVSDEVFDKIDGKAQIFTEQPVPPYNVGDLWVQGASGDIYNCKTPKAAGDSYSFADWVKSSKYTDDTAADEAKGVAEEAKTLGNSLSKGLGWTTEIAEGYVISPVIGGGSLLIGDKKGTYASIDSKGKLTCANAEISGTLKASTVKASTIETSSIVGNLFGGEGSAILGPALGIGGAGVANKNAAECNFYVDSSGNLAIGENFSVDSAGNVTMTGNLTLSDGAITWDALNSSATSKINAAQAAADGAAATASSAESLANAIANGTFSGGTFIDGNTIYSPEIYASTFTVYTGDEDSDGGYEIYAKYNGVDRLVLNVWPSFSDQGMPTTYFEGNAANWNFGNTYFNGNTTFYREDDYGNVLKTYFHNDLVFGRKEAPSTVDFTYAEVKGLTAVATFG